jgi:hypothetical protein
MLPPVVASGTPGAPGDGAWLLPIPLAADPTLVGGTLAFQAVALDAGAIDPDGFVLTDGLRVTLVP